MILVQAILPTAGKRLVTIKIAAPLVEAAKSLSEMDTNLLVVCNPEGRMFGVLSKIKTDSHQQSGI